jgi:hypothetical protein
MICPQCRANCADTFRFCPQCGASLVSWAEAPPLPARPRGSPAWLGPVLAGCIGCGGLLALIVVIGWLYWSLSAPKARSPAPPPIIIDRDLPDPGRSP